MNSIPEEITELIRKSNEDLPTCIYWHGKCPVTGKDNWHTGIILYADTVDEVKDIAIKALKIRKNKEESRSKRETHNYYDIISFVVTEIREVDSFDKYSDLGKHNVKRDAKTWGFTHLLDETKKFVYRLEIIEIVDTLLYYPQFVETL